MQRKLKESCDPEIKGNEVDLLMENGADISAVEIKSGATISSDYFKGLRTLNSRLSSPASACALVYDGQERQQRSDVTVWRAMDVSEMMRSVCLNLKIRS